MDGVFVIEKEHWNNNFKIFHLVREGCLADYINIDKVVECYYLLGLQNLSIDELNYLHDMANYKMISLTSSDNKFDYDYSNPNGLIQWIFNGMFLGYPIESTVSLLDL